ncbi:hypothetical protein IWX90DRAFT_55380 [Phyllosticta citrichinensis]|uniref:Uncharacterized protein n=1 Tax=Phyllosticta citrichinensis TaxID=1130410 RepID=A0ABR1XIN9_9PEZI
MFDLRTAVTHIFQHARQICSAHDPPEHVAKTVRELQRKVKTQGQVVKRQAREAERHEQQIHSLTCQVLDLQQQQLARGASETVCGDVIEGREEQEVVPGSPTNRNQHSDSDDLSFHSARSKSHYEDVVESLVLKTPTEYAVTTPPRVHRGQRQRIRSPLASSAFAGSFQPALSTLVNFDIFETSFTQMKKRPFESLDEEDQNRGQQPSKYFKKIRTDVGATRPETLHGTARMRNVMPPLRANPNVDTDTTLKSSASRTISDPRPTANLERSSPRTRSHLRVLEPDFAFRWGLR